MAYGWDCSKVALDSRSAAGIKRTSVWRALPAHCRAGAADRFQGRLIEQVSNMALTAITAKRRLGEEHSPLRDQVVTELRQAILSGRLKPGERLVEGRLADELGVSRNPVREAIRALASEGLIEVTARRGAAVATMTRAGSARDHRVTGSARGPERKAGGTPARPADHQAHRDRSEQGKCGSRGQTIRSALRSQSAIS